MSFTSFPLDKLNLPPNKLQACQRANLVNASDILLSSISDLSKRLKYKLSDIQDLVRDVSRAIAPSSSRIGDVINNDYGNPESGPSRSNHDEGRIDGDAERRTGPIGLGKRKRWRGGYEEGEWIRTGDEGWDALLGGGIRVGTVTEITGESAAGKSHLSLHLALTSQLPSLSTIPGGTIILTSERQLPTSRLQQLSRSIAAQHASPLFDAERLLSGVLTNRVEDVDSLEHTLNYVIPSMLERGRQKAGKKGQEGKRLKGWVGGDEGDGEVHAEALSRGVKSATFSNGNEHSGIGGKKGVVKDIPIRLLILDSITALLRGQETSYSSTSAGLTARSRHLCLIADKFKALAVEYQIAVIVINQVSDVFERPSYPIRYPNNSNEDDEEEHDSNHRTTIPMPPPPTPSLPKPSQSHASSSQSLTFSQSWYSSGPDPPMLYSTQSRWFSGQSSAKTKEASLGIVWANAINTRIMLSRTSRRRILSKGEIADIPDTFKEQYLERINGGIKDGEVIWKEDDPVQGIEDDTAKSEERMLIRRAQMVFSPFAPTGTVDFVIKGTGIHALKDSYKLEESGERILERIRKREKYKKARGDAGEEDEGVNNGYDDEEHLEGYDAGAQLEDDPYADEGFGLEEIPEGWWEGQVTTEAA